MKVDRHIPVTVNRYYRVNRPVEVIKYVEKPYFVKVNRKVPVEVVKKIPVPQPVVKIEHEFAKPQHITADQLDDLHDEHYHDHEHHNHQSNHSYRHRKPSNKYHHSHLSHSVRESYHR